MLLAFVHFFLIVAAVTHVVTVGQSGLTFSPDSVSALVGDSIEFQFYPKNHSVVQSSFAQPCVRLGAGNSSVKPGLYSGFMPTLLNATSRAIYTISINNTDPLWLYCSQGTHCESGMVMAVNPPATGKTLEQFRLAAKSLAGVTSTSSISSSTASARTATSVQTGITTVGNPSSMAPATLVSPIRRDVAFLWSLLMVMIAW